MSNKSAGPVKTHQEKLIAKAQKAIKEFWSPESDSNASAETENQNTEIGDSQSANLSENNQHTAKNKKRKSSYAPVSQTKSVKKDDNAQSEKIKSKKI